MEKYLITEKKREIKLEGTYVLKLVGGIDFLPPNVGKEYVTFKMRGLSLIHISEPMRPY